MVKGKVYLVGAGPGDAELLTLKGFRLIGQADVILYDHLASAELLAIAAGDAEIIFVGKSANRHTLAQDEINRLIIEKAKQDKIVVRLKGGDPYLFGRGAEEAQACVASGVDFEVVPGVTSALAGPCYAGIPPTHRDYTSSVAIVTGHRKAGKDLQIEIPKAGTIVFLMSVANIANIIDALLEQHWPPTTKIAAVERATCYNQRVVKGELSNFAEKVKQADLQPPAVFIVGKVVELTEELDWFMKKPNTLVLGNHPEKYRHLGNIVHRRIIDCVPIDDYTGIDNVLKDIGSFDWVVFTSVNGAKFFFERLNAAGLDTRVLYSVKTAAIGKTTAQRLRGYGIIADMVAENESSAGLVERFGTIDIKGKKFLLPAAEISSKELYEGLVRLGAVVEKMTVYKTVAIDPGPVDFNFIDQVLFTSGSTVRAFMEKFGAPPSHVKFLCLGEPIRAVAKEYNINAEIAPASAG